MNNPSESPCYQEFLRQAGDLIPDLEQRSAAFTVDASAINDAIMVVFIAQVEKLLTGIRAGLDQADFEVVQQGAHALKGMGGTVGYPHVSVAGQDLEQAARQGDQERCHALTRLIAAWYRQIMA